MTSPIDGTTTAPVRCQVCGAGTQPWARPYGEWQYVRCAACGHVALDDVPSAEELERYYSAQYRYSEASFQHAVEARYLACVDWAQTVAGRRAQTVLEVGCNTGTLLQALRDRGLSVAGVELGDQFRNEGVARGLDVRHSLDAFAGRRVEMLVAFHVIEHVPDLAAELRAWRAHVEAGGLLVVKTPNVECLAARLIRGEWEWSCPPAHINLFSTASLAQALTAAGFRVLRSRTEQGNARSLPFQVARAAGLVLRGRSRRYAPGLDPRPTPISSAGWYKAAEAMGRILSVLGAPAAPLLAARRLLPELTVVAIAT